MTIRNSFRNQGGPFPGIGSAPEMTKAKTLQRGERAAFERLNDLATLRPHGIDVGSLAPANDNDKGEDGV